MAPDRIGITGANGFIGAHLLRSAVAKGFRPVAFLQRNTSLMPIALAASMKGSSRKSYGREWADTAVAKGVPQ